MSWLERVLIATDFGKAAKVARTEAARLALAYGAVVDLVHIRPAVHTQSAERVQTRLAEEGTALENMGTRVGELHIASGSAAESILHTADKLASDLILIGAGDRSLREFTTGATAETVARFANQPVWVARERGRGDVRRVLCGVDGSEASRAALVIGADLAKTLRASLSVLNVFEHGGGSDDEALEQRAARELDQFLASCEVAVPFELSHQSGRASDVLRTFAEKDGTDVLLLGRAGGGLRRVFLGGTAERLLRSAPCSLLLASPVR